jgi:hypothetical protein
MTTHALFTPDDLAILERRLGLKHPIANRVREALADLNDRRLNEYRHAARRHHRDGELEIDLDSAVVSKGDDPGAYVLAWLWVDDTELTS